MGQVACPVVETEVPRADDDHPLLPVLQDVAHLPQLESDEDSSPHLLPQADTLVQQVGQVSPRAVEARARHHHQVLDTEDSPGE